MALQEFLDRMIFGVTLRNIARVIVFGGIGWILIRKVIRRFKEARKKSRQEKN